MTVRQVQCLLLYLGYAPGAADGVLGDRTRRAVREFQKEIGLQEDGFPGTETWGALKHAVAEDWVRPAGDFWKEILYFRREEFACRCGQCGGFPVEPEERLVRLGEQIRTHFGKSVAVSSGVRCERHNARVGGVGDSRHLRGKAMDFSVSGCSAEQVLSYVRKLDGVRYAYAIDGRYVHMDVK